MARRIIVSIVLVIALLAVGAGSYATLLAYSRQPTPVEAAPPMLTVSAVEVQPTTIIAPLEGFGTARADRQAIISSQVAGQVIEVAPNLHDGAAVAAGAALLKIDDRDYRAHLKRARSQLAADEAALRQIDVEQRNLRQMAETAKAELEVAEREFNRIRDLLESGSSSERELDLARVALQRARRSLQDLQRQLAIIPDLRAKQAATCELRRADVSLAELSVQRCTLTAPFVGRLEQVQVDEGEQVAPGQPLFAIVDLDTIEVPVELPVSRRDWVHPGTNARLHLENRPDAVWTGKVARIAPSADPRTRTFSLFVEVNNRHQDTPLMPGLFVRAEIDGPTLTDVLLVPRGAVREERVFLCADGRALARDVRVDQRLAEHSVISGLRPGSVVITSNLDALYEGAPVSPVLAQVPHGLPRAGDDIARRPVLENTPKTP